MNFRSFFSSLYFSHVIRLLKKLKAKDKKQKELEKREQGFSLYLNGANVDLNLRKAENKSSRKARTADGMF